MNAEEKQRASNRMRGNTKRRKISIQIEKQRKRSGQKERERDRVQKSQPGGRHTVHFSSSLNSSLRHFHWIAFAHFCIYSSVCGRFNWCVSVSGRKQRHVFPIFQLTFVSSWSRHSLKNESVFYSSGWADEQYSIVKGAFHVDECFRAIRYATLTLQSPSQYISYDSQTKKRIFFGGETHTQKKRGSLFYYMLRHRVNSSIK